MSNQTTQTTLEFTKTLNGLDGKPIKEQDGKDATLGRFLSGFLASHTKGDALKFFNWAQKLYAGENLDLDDSDKDTLKEFIKSHDQMTVLSKAQMLALFK